MKRLRRLPLLAAAMAALAATGAAFAATGVSHDSSPAASATPTAPTNLRPFMLRPDEPPLHEFTRNPSFAWDPVKGATTYQFELATDPSFNQGTVVWSTSSLKTPATSIPVSLPWMTGNPYALYAHARGILPDGSATPWSSGYGFNLRWYSNPAPITPTIPGMIRWTPVDGATSYDVWWVDADKVVSTKTNAADERETYTFHPFTPWIDAVRYRVRAVRTLYGSVSTGLPAVSYGPWTPIYSATNPAYASGPLTLTGAYSDQVSTSTSQSDHRLTPGFAWTGNMSLDGKSSRPDGKTWDLFRTYVFSDRQCVNVVFRGAIVGSPAYVPRTTGPLALPHSLATIQSAPAQYLPDGAEGTTQMADGSGVGTTESDQPPTTSTTPTTSTGTGGTTGTGTTGTTSGTSGTSGGSTTPSTDPNGSTPAPANSSLPKGPSQTGAAVDLPDSGFPNGRYWWTTVPVELRKLPTSVSLLTSAAPSGSKTIAVASVTGFAVGDQIQLGIAGNTEIQTVSATNASPPTITINNLTTKNHVSGEPVTDLNAYVYRDVEQPQDACAAGRVQSFGKDSEPAVTSDTTPYAAGLTPATSGRVVSASGSAPTFYGPPLVAWKPALGADEYQVEWSPSDYPWRPAGSQTTYATSLLLGNLAPGTWYYRVRGINFLLPGSARAMSWSDPTEIKINSPAFSLTGAGSGSQAVQTVRADFTLWTQATDGFSLSLPNRWQVADAGANKAAPASLVALVSSGGPVRFVGYDPTVVNRFSANVNVATLPPGTLAKALKSARKQAIGHRVAAAPLRLPAGKATRLDYTAPTKIAGKTTPLSFAQFVFDDTGNRALVVTFAYLPASKTHYATTIARVMRSFRYDRRRVYATPATGAPTLIDSTAKAGAAASTGATSGSSASGTSGTTTSGTSGATASGAGGATTSGTTGQGSSSSGTSGGASSSPPKSG